MLTACGGQSGDKPASTEKPASAEKTAVEQPTAPNGKKILVVYFSRTGEEYNVGTITKGNTAIVAEFIAQKVGANTFEIKAETPYPDGYEECTALAKRELESNARPKFVANVDNLAQYDTVFIGFPIWWGAVPRVLLTFLEANDFSGKTIVPFCTHGGSGLAGTEREIAEACPNAKLLDGLAIVGKQCQDAPDAVRKDVDAWLTSLGY
ncbi:MAG: NAD(P)H-dependent oxidoreductase [Selenomonadaceae bacterium]|nr:NAD(P)H-dependent oxidoreductase [Selenomonadaceae bacterium]